MDIQAQIDPEQIYVAGRAGELVDYVNPLTFSLIEKIFGPQGPYRQVLHQFKIGDLANSDQYLTNVFGRVYSNLGQENTVLWQPVGLKITLANNQPHIKNDLLNDFSLPRFKRFLAKSLKEIDIFSNPYVYIEEAAQQYAEFSQKITEVHWFKELTLGPFLTLYQSVVYIAHLYELFRQYYDSTVKTHIQELKEYFNLYDYLNYHADKVIEHAFLQMGFTLGSNTIIESKQSDFAPSNLPTPDDLPAKLRFVAKLRCLKNNIRLKTYLLLYYLNLGFKEQAAQFNLIEVYAFLTINEIQQLNEDNHRDFREQIRARQAYYAEGQKIRLPFVIRNGILQSEDIDLTQRVWQGTACSNGSVTGTLGIITAPDQEVYDPINVFPDASPAYTHLFEKSAGLVFRTGSPLSHGSIVAREFQIPAAVINDDLSILDGKKVRLDGTKGTLTVIE